MLISATAAAPCAKPNCARAMRGQVPRRATTSLPAICASTYSDSLQPSETPPWPSGSTNTASGVPPKSALLEFCATREPRPESATLMPGKVCGSFESIAATLMVF